MSTKRLALIAISLVFLCAGAIDKAVAQQFAVPSPTVNHSAPEIAEANPSSVLARALQSRQKSFSLMAEPGTASASLKASTFNLLPASVMAAVTGSGTPGRLSKWTGVAGTSTFVLGDSTIFEDKFGKVGIGTDSPTSKLTVVGTIEATGGFKFPAGAHDATLKGDGTTASPLGVAVPLNLTGTSSFSILSVTNTVDGSGVRGTANGGTGVIGQDDTGTGVAGTSVNGTGVDGFSTSGIGVHGTSNSNAGVKGTSTNGVGIRGESTINVGVIGTTEGASPIPSFLGAVIGRAVSVAGVGGESRDGPGVIASSFNEDGLIASSSSGNSNRAAVEAQGSDLATGAIAGIFAGNVRIAPLVGSQAGDLTVSGKLQVTSGMKMFHIDHPLDPENKYLNHAAIESSEVLNVYSGNITTDQNGEAVVTLPDWFEALNKDFRYQLTVIGTFAQAIIARKITGNRFAIKTNEPNVEVSWQVTGVRSDPTARKFKFAVEEEKTERERGFYLNPDAYGLPEEKSIRWAIDPEGMKQRRLEMEKMRKRQVDQR